MQAKGYTMKYICAECGHIATYMQYGAASDMMMALNRIVSPPLCRICRPGNRMDVLRVISVLVITIKKTYSMGWRCTNCFSRWSTKEQLVEEDRFINTSVGKNNKPSCVNPSCLNQPKKVQLITISQT